MASINLPEPLLCPASWKYTKGWEKQYERKHGADYLSEICKHSEAHSNIMFHICEMGEKALTKIKKQNQIIKRIAERKVDPANVQYDQIDWQGGYTWEALDENGDALFEVYNAQMAPADIIMILDEVKTFVKEGHLHCQSLLRYLANARQASRDEETRRRAYRLRLMARGETRSQKIFQRALKWDAVDVQHSKATEGFIYVLSNALMPGVYKIGFTAGNPDKRAGEVSAHYGLPMPFEVIEYWRTKDPYIIEQRIHAALASYGTAGEFFEVDLQFLRETIEAFVLREDVSNESLFAE